MMNVRLLLCCALLSITSRTFSVADDRVDQRRVIDIRRSDGGKRYVDATDDAINSYYNKVNLARHFGPLEGDRVGRNIDMRIRRVRPIEEFEGNMGSRKQIFRVNNDRFTEYFRNRDEIVNRIARNIDPFDASMKQRIVDIMGRNFIRDRQMREKILGKMFANLYDQKVSLDSLKDNEIDETFRNVRVVGNDAGKILQFDN